jgi:hypothetical protein
LKIFPAVVSQLMFAVPLPACDHVPHGKRPQSPSWAAAAAADGERG